MKTIASLILLLLMGTVIRAQDNGKEIKVIPIKSGIKEGDPAHDLVAGNLLRIAYLYKFKNSAVRRSLFFIIKKDETVTV